ncbi:MAG TPA: OsmC family protein [Vicinamibacterales bacterium]|nr:OsmC family protein [Vicinamibacterales bacterium]HOG29377.1 OsmC family protein [Vicinamibacterales bacterium]HOQ60191.1 OsmC family protein [Vicinamibacterales bacterium]HPK71122.1 OsmC family protein [Vicinamibacterales bacterium]HPW21141.1 OsmC family protein [Vicinamibacterales bacterium]
MAIHSARAVWKGNLADGNGVMTLPKGAYEGPFTRASRFETGPGTNPEELIGAAHAGCFSMYLSAILSASGFPPVEIRTTATVHLGDGPAITLIELDSEAQVPGCDEAVFLEHAEKAKAGCPVSKALSAVPMTLKAKLVK